jgi:hypothetical protein
MATEVVQQKRRKKIVSNTTANIFQWAREEIDKAGELYYKRKSHIILETARKLEEAGIEKSTICNEISKNLEGFVDDGYVRKILADYPQYKDQKHKESAEIRVKKHATQAQKSKSISQQVRDMTTETEGRTGYLNEEHECYKDVIIKGLEERIAVLESKK